jgi:hypothetical protein
MLLQHRWDEDDRDFPDGLFVRGDAGSPQIVGAAIKPGRWQVLLSCKVTLRGIAEPVTESCLVTIVVHDPPPDLIPDKAGDFKGFEVPRLQVGEKTKLAAAWFRAGPSYKGTEGPWVVESAEFQWDDAGLPPGLTLRVVPTKAGEWQLLLDGAATAEGTFTIELTATIVLKDVEKPYVLTTTATTTIYP